jgi:hypothetical protein
MTATDDHGTLPAHAERLLHRLERLEGISVHGETQHMQHTDHARRARQLSDHLRAVLVLNDDCRYPSALVVVRAALEHHLMDRLIFLANRSVETVPDVKKTDVPEWDAKLLALQQGGSSDIAKWRWDNQGLHIIRRGYHGPRSKKGRGETISPYYFHVDQYDPFTGPKKHAARLARPFRNSADSEAWAAESLAEWRQYFTHGQVLTALRVNRLLPGIEAVQVDVHYAFLSGFAHPSSHGYQAVYGRDFSYGIRKFDHYASELALLYVIAIAATELDIFARMARRAPRLGLSGWSDVEAEMRAARLASEHFWFLGGGPTMFDRINTAHTPPGRSGPKWGRPRVDPATIKTERVRYYSDPLDRLAKLHASYQEISTGLVYRSPFERPDARLR